MSRRSERDAERIVWVGHATVVLELGSARLITDPVLRNRIVHLRRRAPAPAPAELEDLDAVLISHLHLDHLDVPSLRRLGRGAPLIVPRGAGGMLVRLGFCDITELAVGESVDIRGVTVTAVPADHDGHRRPHGPFAHPVGFVVTGARQVYFAGDTALFADMAHLGGALDVALLPIWGWGPTLGPGHLSPRGAAEALVLLRPAVAVPIHWGTFFPAGLARLHPAALVEPPRAFVREAARFAPGVRVRVLEPGEALSLSPAPS
jgi:L-ascorbate metabolism protein UlaG (beta-lactamase superfamily)